MTRTRRWIVFACAVVCAGSSELARGQSLTSGAIQGTVTDEKSDEPIAGVIVEATSPALQGTQSDFTNESGFYKLTNLPIGIYVVTFTYGDIVIRRNNVFVTTNRTTPVYIKIGSESATGEVIEIKGKAPTVDPTTTTQGITVDEAYLKNIPVPGRTFDSALGGAAGSQNDGVGVSFSGSTSLENQYVVDGANTTGLGFGNVGTPVLNSFVQEIEVLTGGYNAEYGRATGGVVNVVTRQGSNEFHGEVYSYFSNQLFRAAQKQTPNFGSPIITTNNIDYDTELGVALGGPIIKDKLWFFFGVSPQLQGATVDKITRRNTDCRGTTGASEVPINRPCTAAEAEMFGDGAPDQNPDTGKPIFERIDTVGVKQNSQAFPFFGKINYAPLPAHQGQLSIIGNPSFAKTQGVAGDPAALSRDNKSLTTDMAAKWTSKFQNNQTEVEALIGWHRATVKSKGRSASANSEPRQNLAFGDLGTWGEFGFESNRTRVGCRDSSDRNVDIYPDIINCPDGNSAEGALGGGSGYAIGGAGRLFDDKEERRSGSLSVTHRRSLLGNHEFKSGIDLEDNRTQVTRDLSGGQFISNLLDRDRIEVTRFVELAPPDTTSSRFDDICRNDDNEEIMCDFSPSRDVLGQTLNWAAYLRDSWQPIPNLTLNLGLRYEEQRLRFAEHLRGVIDPLTTEERPKNAMVLKGMWAPRLGAIYDWTREGRSKVYASWGRYYESIPLNINDRSFGGEAIYVEEFDATVQCGGNEGAIGGPNGNNCEGVPADPDLLGSGILVAPGIQAQYLDELVVGAEYEVFEDLKVGLGYRNRVMGRILEDVSTDNAATYIIANPGEFPEAEERRLQAEIDALPEGDAKRAQLEANLEMFRGIRLFDKGRREYHAFEVTATRRFSRDLYLQGNYTYSITRGNFPGLFSADNGQVDPNITSQFDLIELLANRDGLLPQDRPHQIKIDGFKLWDMKGLGQLVTGIRLRLLSGTPTNALGRHYRYGFDESFLLPRGATGRTDFTHQLDIQVKYGKEIAKGYLFEFFIDAFRVFNNQDEFFTDQSYTFSNANPIVGGKYEDLVYLKRVNDNGGETDEPVGRNENFGNTTSRYTPFFMRFGARLTF